MAKIESGDSADLLKVDPISKAARVTLYGVDGEPIDDAIDGAYSVAVEIIPATITLGTAYFAMRNNGTKTAYVNRLELCMGFNGTAAATRSTLSLSRFDTASPSGGTPKSVVKRSSGYPPSTIGEVLETTGALTVAGVAFDAPIQLFTVQNQLHASHFISIEMSKPIILQPNEGLAIRAHTAQVVGVFLTGAIYWTEK